MKKIIGVYKISNNLCPEGKYYIGYSSHIRSRWNNHKRHLKNEIHINMYLQRAYNKYGAECFTYEILHECETKEEAQEYETSYLQDLTIRDKLYNLLYDSIGGDTITHHPNREEILRKNKILRQLHPQTSFRKDAPIVIDGINYSGITEAGKILNIRPTTINDRIYSYSPKFINYHFLDEKKQAEALNKGLIRIENRKEKHKEFSTGRGVPILIDNIYYSSMRDAAKVLNIGKDAISKRVKSKKYQNYQITKYDAYYTKPNCVTPIMVDKKCMTRQVIIDNIYYKSLSDASRKIGVSLHNIRKRILSPNPIFDNYFYADTIEDEVKPSSLLLLLDDTDSH